MNIINISLSKLVASDKNVRVTAGERRKHNELVASIAAHGLLQNLVVEPAGRGKFSVIAGGRRHRALQALAKNMAIGKNHPIPCAVREKGEDVVAVSLAENVQREAMHPADEYVAFANMIKEGKGIEDVAAAFGVTSKIVQKRMKLGQVAPKILDEYRKENLNLDAVMAFTVTDDQERQMACYEELGGRYWPHSIKDWLLGEAVTTKRGIGAFVGKAAYVKAGGAVSEDLFQESVYLGDTALVAELAQAKLDRAAKKLEKEQGGWMWIETTLNRQEALEPLVQLNAEYVDVPKTLTDKIEALQTKLQGWEDAYYDNELPEGFEDDEALEKAMGQAETELGKLDEEKDEYLVFTDEQKAYSGCLVTFNQSGKLDVISGLARQQDYRNANKAKSSGGSEAGSGAGEGGKDANKPKGISQSLKDDLGNYRKQAVKAALLRDPAAAADVLLYSQCMQLMSGIYGMGRNLSSVSISSVACTTKLDDTGEGRAHDEMAKAREALSLEWMQSKDEGERFLAEGERFLAFRKLSKREKEKLMAYCAAESLQIGIRGSSSDQDALVEQLGVDFAGYWRPTRENYFSRISKDQMFEQFTPVLGQDWADYHDDMKKGSIVENLHERFAAKPKGKDDPIAAWIPEQF